MKINNNKCPICKDVLLYNYVGNVFSSLSCDSRLNHSLIMWVDEDSNVEEMTIDFPPISKDKKTLTARWSYTNNTLAVKFTDTKYKTIPFFELNCFSCQELEHKLKTYLLFM